MPYTALDYLPVLTHPSWLVPANDLVTGKHAATSVAAARRLGAITVRIRLCVILELLLCKSGFVSDS